MRTDVVRILRFLGYRPEIDFRAGFISDTNIHITWLAAGAMPTDAEIDAAAPAAEAALAAEAAQAAQLAALRTQAISAIATLDAIQASASPTNAQVVQAVKDLAQIQEKVIRVVFQTLT